MSLEDGDDEDVDDLEVKVGGNVRKRERKRTDENRREIADAMIKIKTDPRLWPDTGSTSPPD